MNPTVFKEIAEGLGALIAAGGFLAAAGIFLAKREWRPRVQLTVAVDAFQKVGDNFLLEPVCIAENRGLLRCYIHRLQMSVRYLRRGEKLEIGGERILFATNFPHQALKIEFIKPDWEWTYLEAGIHLRYSHVIHVPSDAVALLIWVKLFPKKGDANDFFSAQKVLMIVDDHLSNEARTVTSYDAAQQFVAGEPRDSSLLNKRGPA